MNNRMLRVWSNADEADSAVTARIVLVGSPGKTISRRHAVDKHLIGAVSASSAVSALNIPAGIGFESA
jgi:hypothetical protein